MSGGQGRSGYHEAIRRKIGGCPALHRRASVDLGRRSETCGGEQQVRQPMVNCYDLLGFFVKTTAVLPDYVPWYDTNCLRCRKQSAISTWNPSTNALHPCITGKRNRAHHQARIPLLSETEIQSLTKHAPPTTRTLASRPPKRY